MASGLEEIILGQRARREETDDVALHHCLGAPLPCLRRVFQLLADSDPVSHADQFLQIGVCRMDGHPAHGDILALVLAALGQRDAERIRGNFGILEKKLVEIAHPEEQQTARIGLLEHQELRHDGRCAAGGLLPRSLAHMVYLGHGAFHSRNRPKRYKRRFRNA